MYLNTKNIILCMYISKTFYVSTYQKHYFMYLHNKNIILCMYIPKTLFSGIWFLQQQLWSLIYPWNNADLISSFKADSQNSGLGMVAAELRFSSWKRQNFLFPKSILALGHISIYWVHGDITLGIKRPKREAGHLPPSSADINLLAPEFFLF